MKYPMQSSLFNIFTMKTRSHVDILVLLEAHLCPLVMSTCETCRHSVFGLFLILLLLLLLLLLSNTFCVKPTAKTAASINLILGGQMAPDPY